MTTRRGCIRCDADIGRRHRLAIYCFPCSYRASAAGGRKEARYAVAKAVRLGALPRASTLLCVDCGQQARDYDHRDYSKPLEVQPVCRSCNKLRGPGIERAAA